MNDIRKDFLSFSTLLPKASSNDFQKTPAVMMPLLSVGLLRIAGAEATHFLQGQVTCHIPSLSPTYSSLAAHCNQQGRMQSFFRIRHPYLTESPCYFLSLPETMVSIAIKQFQKYALFSKVTIEHEKERLLIGFAGSNCAQKLSLFFQNSKIETLATHESLMLSWQKVCLALCSVPGNRFELLLPERAFFPLWEALCAFFQPIEASFWEYLEIQAQIPAVYPSTRNQLLPHHANLTHFSAISFEKGCYLGQEVVARMHYRGTLKKGLCCARMVADAYPQPGDPIQISGTDKAGLVLRSTLTPAGYALLIMTEKEICHDPSVWLDVLPSPPSA